MNPNDPFREQTTGLIYAVVICLIFWALVVTLILWATTAKAAEVVIGWNANPVAEGVTEYRVYRLSETKTLIATSATNEAVIQAETGDVIAITAWNGCESLLSDSIVIPPYVVLTVEGSYDLDTWETIRTIEVQPAEKQFFRLKIVKP